MKGIIGAIAGDIIGSTHEFHPIKTKKREFLSILVNFMSNVINIK